MHIKRFSLIISVFVVVMLAFSAQASTVSYAQDSKIAAHKATVMQFMDAFAHSDKLATLDSITAKGYVDYSPQGKTDLASIKAGAESFIKAMPDINYKTLIVIANEEWAALRYEQTGTFTNALVSADGSSLPPTGKPVLLTGNVLVKFDAESKIEATWEAYDQLSFAVQFGAMPAMDGGAALPPPDASIWQITPTSADAMTAMETQIKAVIDQAWNKGDLSVVDSALDPAWIGYPTYANPQAFKDDITNSRAAMPDIKVTVDPIVIEGNWAAFHLSYTGTFTHDLTVPGMNIKATNKPVSLEGIIFLTTNQAGKVIAEWDEFDNYSFLVQVGVIPAPAK
ncbi:MAG: ester cyclase [Anaerolineae bacterium]|nr:ester cyclase [Anaerolineae bacterium]